MRDVFSTLLMTTALSVPFATAVSAQDRNSYTAHDRLIEVLHHDLPQEIRTQEARIMTIAKAGEGEICRVELERVQQTAGMDAVERDTETAKTQLILQDKLTVEGTVFLEQTPPTVDVTSGKTQVEIQPGRPTVDIAEQAGQIIVRQAPANITVDMPQPTIRIEQSAPEIIRTAREGYTPVNFEQFDYSALKGATVFGNEDETVGNISDMFVGSSGSIDAVIVGIGGFLGIGERMVETPFDRLSILQGQTATDLRVYVNATRDQLNNLPAYDG